MNATPQAQGEASGAGERELDALVQDIARLEAVVAGWEPAQQAGVQALKQAIEALHKEALRRLIRRLKQEPAAATALREALGDPLIWAVLLHHGLVREPLEARVRKALEDVQPYMAAHGGGVELVAVKAPDTVEIRLTGACHSCPASSTTLSQGVEKALREHCPEIQHIRQVSRGQDACASPDNPAVHYISPFALNAKGGWQDLALLTEIPERGVLERMLKGRSLLLSRQGDAVSCFDNRCAHLGMPLDMGEVREGVIRCPYHGFEYLLESGECLTASEVQLCTHAVRVIGERVQVRLEGGGT